MFKSKIEMLELYEKIENKTATDKEIKDFNFNIETCSFNRDFIIAELKKELKK